MGVINEFTAKLQTVKSIIQGRRSKPSCPTNASRGDNDLRYVES